MGKIGSKDRSETKKLHWLDIKLQAVVESQNQKRPRIWTHNGSFCREAFWYSWEAFLSTFKGSKLRCSFASISREQTTHTTMFDWNMGLQTNSVLEMWVRIYRVCTRILTRAPGLPSPSQILSGTCCCGIATVGTFGGYPGSGGLIFF